MFSTYITPTYVLAVSLLLVVLIKVEINYNILQLQEASKQSLRPSKGFLPKCVDQVYTQSSRKQNLLKGAMVFENRHEWLVCKFEKDGPIPVVFIVLGRSGSDATWSTISKLAGGKSPLGEHTGENKVKAMEFLTNMKTEEAGKWWLTAHLCEFAHKYCDRPLAAFKWKPFIDSWKLPAAQGILKQLAEFDDPRIKVIYMTRNPLDVMISNYKHERNKNLTAHCHTGDQSCIEGLKKLGTGLHLPTETLVQDLKNQFEAFGYFEKTLDEMNIHHVKTTYKKLYQQDHAEEWMKLFKFLGKGPTEGLTMDDIVNSFELAPTFQKNHNVTLSNYEEVRDLLIGTDFENLLH